MTAIQYRRIVEIVHDLKDLASELGAEERAAAERAAATLSVLVSRGEAEHGMPPHRLEDEVTSPASPQARLRAVRGTR